MVILEVGTPNSQFNLILQKPSVEAGRPAAHCGVARDGPPLAIPSGKRRPHLTRHGKVGWASDDAGGFAPGPAGPACSFGFAIYGLAIIQAPAATKSHSSVEPNNNHNCRWMWDMREGKETLRFVLKSNC